MWIQITPSLIYMIRVKNNIKFQKITQQTKQNNDCFVLFLKKESHLEQKQIHLALYLQSRIKLMRFSCYEWSPNRFHPQFNGIGQRYAEQKRRRLAYQNRRKELDSDKSYTIKVNQQMEKQLYSKTLQLSRLKQARKRHLDQLYFKQMLFEKRQQEIRSLRESNNKERQTLKNNIEQARKNMQAHKQGKRQQLQQESKLNNSRLELMLKKRHEQNSSKYNKIKEEEQIAHSRVDEFHRQQNQKSLNAYRARITQQNKIRSREQRKIKKYEQEIALMNQTAMMKREKLIEIQSQITQLSTQTRAFTITSHVKPKRRQYTDVSFHTYSNISLSSDINQS